MSWRVLTLRVAVVLFVFPCIGWSGSTPWDYNGSAWQPTNGFVFPTFGYSGPSWCLNVGGQDQLDCGPCTGFTPATWRPGFGSWMSCTPPCPQWDSNPCWGGTACWKPCWPCWPPCWPCWPPCNWDCGGDDTPCPPIPVPGAAVLSSIGVAGIAGIRRLRLF